MLFPHNVGVFNDLEKTLEQHNCCCVIMGTGVGKTYVTSEYLDKYNLRALVVAPRNSICDSWKKHRSDVDTITYQKLANIYKDIDYSHYDIVICDEVHHIGAPTWGKPIKYLIDNNIIKVVGLTESSIRYSDGGKDVAEDFFYGNVAYGETVPSAIEKKILNPVTYVGAMYNSDGLKQTIRGKIQSRLYAKLNLVLNKTPTIAEILKKNMLPGKRKGIIFASTIEDINSAIEFVKSVYPKVEIRFVHSKQPESYNTSAFEWFKNVDEGYLCSVDMISEGVHIKGVNTLIMLRRTESVNLFNQQLGRCLDASSKEPAILFDLVNNKYSIRVINNRLQVKINSIFDSGKLNIAASEQLIIKDYTKDIVDVLKEIKLNLEGTWTEQEDNLLKQFYVQNPTGKGLKKFVEENFEGRTVSSASNRAIRLGLSVPYSVPYTKEEIKIIKKYYPIEGPDCYTRLSNRSRAAVQRCACTMGIKFLNAWTKEEDDLLKELYEKNSKVTLEEMSLKYFPQRSKGSINRRAANLGLTTPNVVRFTEEEDNIIRQYYRTEGAKCLLRMSNHTKKSLYARVRDLGLSCENTKIWTEEEDEIFRKYYPIEGTKIEKRLEGRNRPAIIKHAQRLGIQKQKPLILCVELNKYFKTAKEAADFLNQPKGQKAINETLNKRRKSAYDYHWEYVEEEN